MTEKLQQLESVVIRSLRLFRDRYFPYKADKEDLQPAADQGNEEKEESGFLESLPVSLVSMNHYNLATLIITQFFYTENKCVLWT